jgi:hypothetical protein
MLPHISGLRKIESMQNRKCWPPRHRVIYASLRSLIQSDSMVCGDDHGTRGWNVFEIAERQSTIDPISDVPPHAPPSNAIAGPKPGASPAVN